MERDLEKEALELGKKYNCKVHPIMFKKDEDSKEVIGFIKEPNRGLKIMILDMANKGTMSACTTLFDAVLLTEDSDPLFITEDAYYFGGALEAMQFIEVSSNLLAKK